MVHLVEALRYNPKGRGFDSRWFHWSNGPGLDSTSKRNEYQEYFLRGKGADSFSTLMSRLSGNVVASTSWNPDTPNH